MAEYVTDEGCGLTIGSLREIPKILASVDDTKYRDLKKNAERAGLQMRRGQHIRKAAEKALEIIENEITLSKI